MELSVFFIMFSIVCFLVLLFTANNAFAQQQVHGVETKLTTYFGPAYTVQRVDYFEWFGYSFTNMNSIPVSVEAELYENLPGRNDCDETRVELVTTKSFVLQPKETYIWKFENKEAFKKMHWRKTYDEPSNDRYGNGYRETSFYVKFKAYKLE